MEYADALGPALVKALERKGFTSLTAVQKAVLAPELATRDLRITSQTGSGKTVAIGFALRTLIADVSSAPEDGARKRGARPRAIVIAPTRELAKQVETELTWLYAPLRVRIASTTGGASYREEHRALAAGPAIVVGTPGRLLDHLTRGAIDPSGVAAVCLDEADRMLDLGFRDELEAIFALLPKDRRTHLVSATFPRDVRALADRVQRDPAHVEGTRLGVANSDIRHVLYPVDGHERMGAMINLLLAHPEAQTLVFARTRADVAQIALRLSQAGFTVTPLSGEMPQAARNRALEGFRRGDVRVLVATDVAARGIDVQDIASVIHAEPPTNTDDYVHRSGRTGRAGRKGTSSVLVVQRDFRRVKKLLEASGVQFTVEPIPSAESIRRMQDDRLMNELTRDDGDLAITVDARTKAIASRLLQTNDPERAVARLLARMRATGASEPHNVRAITPPVESSKKLPRRGRDRHVDPHPRKARHRRKGNEGPSAGKARKHR